jgi:hypothetical protein
VLAKVKGNESGTLASFIYFLVGKWEEQNLGE